MVLPSADDGVGKKARPGMERGIGNSGAGACSTSGASASSSLRTYFGRMVRTTTELAGTVLDGFACTFVSRRETLPPRRSAHVTI